MAARLEELQFTLGEGPCVDAYCQDRPVIEPDLADVAVGRWVAYAALAVDAGVRAVFAFPLRVGGVRLGALSLYSDYPGPLGHEQHCYAKVMADVIAEALILMQAKAPPGRLPAEVISGCDTRAVVHQAAGMMSGQLDVTVAQALVELRLHAFSTNRRLIAVAENVVARYLRFHS